MVSNQIKLPLIILAFLLIAGVVIVGIGKHNISSPIKTVTPVSQPNTVPGDNLTLGLNHTVTAGSFLTAYNGMTLYVFTQDTFNESNCVGICTHTWLPYTVTSKNNLVAEYPIAGNVGTVTRTDGSLQITYNGYPLYFYAGDHMTIDTNGIGLSKDWILARP